jgi:hypothetical protein
MPQCKDLEISVVPIQKTNSTKLEKMVHMEVQTKIVIILVTPRD